MCISDRIIIVTAVLIGVLYWFFGTELGCAIRATGSNPAMSRAQGINKMCIRDSRTCAPATWHTMSATSGWVSLPAG